MSAYLSITLNIAEHNRKGAAAVYARYRQPFLDSIKGARSKELLIRDEDVIVLHGFDSSASAQAYLASDLFTKEVVTGLQPYLAGNPDIRIYAVV
jgi:heme-degrading monooxygenase HmoA